jgi:flagellar basal body-associated protein FliL
VYTVLDGNLTFDVLVLSAKSQWTSLSRWEDAAAAQNEARKLVSGKKHLGVKVTQESYDEAENRFSEKTVFKHMKNESKARQPEEEDEDDFEHGEFDDYDDGIDWVLPVFGILIFAIIMGIGIYFFEDKINLMRSTKSDYFVYELPAVMTNVSSGKETFSVKINLQLELDNSRDSKAVEFALAEIMESVIDEVQQTDAGDLHRSEKIQLLRAELRQKIQDAMGDTNLNGVLFRDIQVF